MTACTKESKYNPRLQEKTQWKSGNISVYIVDSNRGVVTFQNDDKIIVLNLEFGFNDTFVMDDDFSEQNTNPVPEIEIWELQCKKNEFKATVHKTAYFEQNQEIVFNRVAENVDENEIPYPPKTNDSDTSHPESTTPLVESAYDLKSPH